MNKSLLYLFLSIVLLTGCNSIQNHSPSKTEDSNQPKEEITNENSEKVDDKEEASEEPSQSIDVEYDPLPTTFQELEQLRVGNDSGPIFDPDRTTQEQRPEVAERFSDLPNIKGEPTKEELDYFYRELIRRIQVDFQGPEQLIKELKYQSLGNPEIEDTRYQFKNQLNIVIILDASGSMANDAGGKSRMEAAKEAITNFLDDLPKEANVALRVYGNKGTGSDSDMELSCGSTELVYNFQTYDSTKFKDTLKNIQPAGWTPTGLALTEAQKDLQEFDGDKNTNIVYLVSDGIETCDTNPVKAAENLYNSNITPIINVIGFGVDGEGQNHLREIADSVDGIYQTVTDESELTKELEKTNNIANAWKNWKEEGMQSLDLQESSNRIKIFIYSSQQDILESDERKRASRIMRALWSENYMSDTSLEYLEEKNNEYHAWIQSEIEKFEQELEALNEANYQEAIKAIEEKYQLNTDG